MNSRHDAVYAHLALRDPKSIRVFDLQPYHPDFPDATISGTLRVVDLATSPHYVALSYVWGTSSSPARTIACGAHSVAVTDNLWDALDSLRRDPQREDRGRNSDGSITLWIDALCIHQSNQQEVASQIHLMGDIYASSSSLCIWLGKDTPLSDKAVDFMQRVGWQDLFEKEGEYFYRMPTSKTRWTLALLEFTKILAMALRLGRAPKRSWNASLDETDEILSNVWTRRMWTLQEASMSPHPWICYGSRRLSWRNVLYATQYLNWAPQNMEDFNTGFRKTDYEAWYRIASMWASITQPPRDGYWDSPSGHQGPRVVLRDYVDFLHGVHARTQFLLRLGTYVFTASLWITAMCCVSLIPGIPSHRVYIVQIVLGVWFGLYSLAWAMSSSMFNVPYPGDRQSVLDEAVQETWLRDCSQPQDKVYGVHGVMMRLGVELLPVDMSVRLGNLYRDFFLDLLQATRNLNLLLAAGSALSDQPSWVPDWRLKLADHWIDPSVYLGKRMSSVVRVTRMKRPKWGRGMEGYSGIYGFGPGDGLNVKGWKIGRVAWMGAAFTPISTNVATQEAEKTPHIQNLEILQVAMKRSRCSRNNPGYYVFSAPLTRTAKQPDPKFKRHHPIDWSVDWRRPGSDILEKLGRKPAVWSVFVNDMCNPLAAKRRTLFWSDGPVVEGLGNLPASARVGDEVLLVCGVSLPVVLRRRDDGDGFQLIGYAVFESLEVMEGKIWEKMMVRDEGDGLQTYTIN